MAIANALGLGGIMGNAAQQGNIYTTSNTNGMYQDPSRWNQEQAYREEMKRREERAYMEQRYREEIQRYGYPVPEQAAEQKVKAKPANSFPEGYEKKLLLLLEN